MLSSFFHSLAGMVQTFSSQSMWSHRALDGLGMLVCYYLF
ncbi:Uncharacterised protein [Vibrio cholerae]|nr:Uncharacterised protein [Vibrio cholerae]CSI90679.1 Uncharacterised protein [Vibrio cholerae]